MPGLESELQTERSKTAARWFVIAIMAMVVYRQQQQGVLVMPLRVFFFLLGSTVVINLAHSFYLLRARACSPLYKYLSVGLDLLFVTFTIRYTGFNQSPFFYIYFLILVSNCIRYGLVMSLYIGLLVNVLYVIVLSFAPELRPTVLGGEGLKILAFWGVALYGGAVSARMRRQSFEIADYEETIFDLREALRQKEAATTAPEIQDPKPQPVERLRLMDEESDWMKVLAPTGLVFLLL
ncbi:MAG TPA: hypothetical protein VNA16_06825, partial [Abditibacteriaceae bacterium]|nr:hypothetical protein [Abditibacteriaceae bacterium]